MPIELKTKQGNISLTAPKATGGSIDLSNYYTKTQTDKQISEAVNALDEKITIEFDGYALKSYVEDAIANIDIPEVDLTGYAKTEDIPDISGLQTEAQVIELITDALAEIGVAEDGEY